MMTTDSGVLALSTLLRQQGIAAEPEQLGHQMGLAGRKSDVIELLRAARQFGVKARCLATRWDRLVRTPLPAIAVRRDGGFMLVGKATGGKVIVLGPGADRPGVV